MSSRRWDQWTAAPPQPPIRPQRRPSPTEAAQPGAFAAATAVNGFLATPVQAAPLGRPRGTGTTAPHAIPQAHWVFDPPLVPEALPVARAQREVQPGAYHEVDAANSFNETQVRRQRLLQRLRHDRPSREGAVGVAFGGAAVGVRGALGPDGGTDHVIEEAHLVSDPLMPEAVPVATAMPGHGGHPPEAVGVVVPGGWWQRPHMWALPLVVASLGVAVFSMGISIKEDSTGTVLATMEPRVQPKVTDGPSVAPFWGGAASMWSSSTPTEGPSSTTSPFPTTLAPTTLAPTTLAPTTLAPTTLAPTTLAPTTLAPTTLAPTTLAPTTLAPTTLAPTTQAPTTSPPTMEASQESTNVPTTSPGGVGSLTEFPTRQSGSGVLTESPRAPTPTASGFVPEAPTPQVPTSVGIVLDAPTPTATGFLTDPPTPRAPTATGLVLESPTKSPDADAGFLTESPTRGLFRTLSPHVQDSTAPTLAPTPTDSDSSTHTTQVYFLAFDVRNASLFHGLTDWHGLLEVTQAFYQEQFQRVLGVDAAAFSIKVVFTDWRQGDFTFDGFFYNLVVDFQIQVDGLGLSDQELRRIIIPTPERIEDYIIDFVWESGNRALAETVAVYIDDY